MKIEQIAQKLTSHKNFIIDSDKKLIASVLIPLVEKDNETYLLFQRRSSKIKTQPGEVSFPGGKVEPSDIDFSHTAIRETCEELGTSPENIELIREMDTLVTPFNVIVFNFLGKIKDITNLNINKDEVEYIFLVPIDYFLNNKPLEVLGTISLTYGDDFPREKTPNGVVATKNNPKNRALFYEYEDNVIWGFTALIIENLVKAIKKQL